MLISGAGFPCLLSSPCQLWGAGSDCLSSGALALGLGWVAGSGFLGGWIWLWWLALSAGDFCALV